MSLTPADLERALYRAEKKDFEDLKVLAKKYKDESTLVKKVTTELPVSTPNNTCTPKNVLSGFISSIFPSKTKVEVDPEEVISF